MRTSSSFVVLATHNQHKVREIQKILRGFPLPIKGLEAFPSYSVRETGKTLEANALLKARIAVRKTGVTCLADDTGLEVTALKGEPGVRSARFAGPGCDFAANNRKLLRLLSGVATRKRTAAFRCVVAVIFPDGTEKVFEGKCPGLITSAIRGKKGFGYDPIFQPAGQKKTFAQMSLGKKNKISHRFRAFAKAKTYLVRVYRSSPHRFAAVDNHPLLKNN